MSNKYEPQTYWEERAKTGGKTNFLRPVMILEATDRENATLDRLQKIMMRQIVDKLDLVNRTVFEYGCGVGRWYPFFSQRGAHWCGIDISETMIALAHQYYGDIDAQILTSTTLPFDDESFDLVYTVTVIHHNPYETQAKMASELERILRKNGHCLLFEGLPQRNNSSNMFPRPVEDWVQLGQSTGLTYQQHYLGSFLFFRQLATKLFNLKNPSFRKGLANLDYWLDPWLLPITSRVKPSVALIHFQK